MEISADRAQWEEHLSYYFKGSMGEIGGDHGFTIRCNTKCFVVTVSPSSGPDSKAGLLLSRYNEAIQTDDHEESQNIENEVLEIIYEAGWRIFAQLAPSPESRVPGFPRNLYSDLIQKHSIFV
jgi:hypothetical protein